ncbi:hypothetical protein NDU88_003117 [Pleurodeles waltl]|uniref:Uncharacterized protein n=1 Tax=Pleurodeles waltl TaxID=8319 RepID=A0AAV7VCG7_PLEWA|nr:hypothetical protein NDU88_003117 [Pleurodeles waltl]
MAWLPAPLCSRRSCLDPRAIMLPAPAPLRFSSLAILRAVPPGVLALLLHNWGGEVREAWKPESLRDRMPARGSAEAQAEDWCKQGSVTDGGPRNPARCPSWPTSYFCLGNRILLVRIPS